MNNRLRWVSVAITALLFGTVGFLLFGHGPQAVGPVMADQSEWTLPAASPQDAALAAQAWNKRPPWGAPTADPAQAAPPAARVVGAVLASGRWLALFDAPDHGLVRLAADAELPGGGQVILVAPDQVVWRDAHGVEHRHRLLAGRTNEQSPGPAIPEPGATEPSR